MKLDFNEDGWKGMTADRATELVSHLPLNIRKLEILEAKFGVKFAKALIERVGQCKKLKHLFLYGISCGDVDEGEELGVRMAEVISANVTIEKIWLWNTYFLVVNNVNPWGE